MQSAHLADIRYSELQRGSTLERHRLFQACCDDGFLYLDYEGLCQDFTHVVRDIFNLQKELFELPVEEKLKYDIDILSPRKLNGYKPIGRNHGDIAGRRDGFESYALPKNELMASSDLSFSHPPCVDKYIPVLRIFCNAMSDLICTILSSLSDSLQLDANDRLENKHRTRLATPDLIRLLKYHPQPASEEGASHVAHTDLGSLTILFTEQPGLQVKNAEWNEWETVEPLPGHAIVNIGDSLSMLTGGRFSSCLHRVAPLVRGEARQERYSFAYFSRAEDHVRMQAVSSPFIARSVTTKSPEDEDAPTSLEWMQQKYKALRKDTWTTENNAILIRSR